MIHDPSMCRLGKLRAVHDPRTLRLARYLPRHLPPPPPAVDWTADMTTPLGMMLNDAIGDCTVATAGHMTQVWTDRAGNPYVPADADILTAYEAISGYDPATGRNDDGAVELDVLKYWRKTGIAGRRIEAFVSVDPHQPELIEQAVALFEGAYVGIALPTSAQDQDIWAVPAAGLRGDGEPGSWGGHAVPIVGYDADGLTVVTWGALKRMTWGFVAAYMDEAYAIISPDMLELDGRTPLELDLTQLRADLDAL